MSVADEASLAFQKQIDALRESERIQKERAATPPPEAAPDLSQLNHAERSRLLRQRGVHDDELPYFNAFYDHLDIGHEAMQAVLAQGIERGTPAFHRAVKRDFEERMLKLTPEPLEYHEPIRRGGNIDPAMPTGLLARFNGTHEDSPGTVRLTPAMKEAAAIAGISERQYAENVLRLREEKLQGNYGGQP